MKYLPLYYEWIETGRLKNEGTGIIGGLCGTVLGSDDEFNYLFGVGQDFMMFWAAGTFDKPDRVHGFTPLRQNIVLLLAAINEEL